MYITYIIYIYIYMYIYIYILLQEFADFCDVQRQSCPCLADFEIVIACHYKLKKNNLLFVLFPTV